MEIAELKQFLIKHEWEEDRFGHLKFKASNGKIYRFKIQKKTFRLEVQTYPVYRGLHGEIIGHGKKKWLRLRSGYYTQTHISYGDQITGTLWMTDMEGLVGGKIALPPEVNALFENAGAAIDKKSYQKRL
jgi:hypothetical protein